MLKDNFSQKTKNIERTVLVEKVEKGIGEGLDEYYVRHSFKYNGEEGTFVKIGKKVMARESVR